MYFLNESQVFWLSFFFTQLKLKHIYNLIHIGGKTQGMRVVLNITVKHEFEI